MAAKESGGAAQSHDAQLSNVALLYYKEGLTQSEISARIGVSRATIVNYLRQAREQGIVDIRIKGEAFSTSNLSRDLRDKFGLVDVYIAGSDPTAPPTQQQVSEQVAHVAAMAMFDLLVPGDRLGVAWGETMQLVSQAFPRRTVENLSVCQLLGSMSLPTTAAAEACTIQIASNTGARCYTLHAPAIVSNSELARQLREEPVIAGQLAEFSQLTKAYFSVGAMDDATLMVTSGMCSGEQLEAYRARGAKAILCGHFIDAEGKPLAGDIEDRLIGISPQQLKAIPVRMFVSNGVQKRDPIRAVVAGGYASHLVTDEATALHLMRDGD